LLEQKDTQQQQQRQRGSALETLKDASAARMALGRAEAAYAAAAAAVGTNSADDGLTFDLFGGRHVVTTEAFAHPSGTGVNVKRPYNPHARYQPGGGKRARNVTINTNTNTNTNTATTTAAAADAVVAAGVSTGSTGTAGNATRTSMVDKAKATTIATAKGSSGNSSSSSSLKDSSAGGDWSSWFSSGGSGGGGADADADAGVGVDVNLRAGAEVGAGAGGGEMLAALSARGRLTVAVSAEAVRELVEACGSKHSVVALALVWSDLSTTHDTSTVKHCIGVAQCSRPFCACHRSVRASIAYKPLLGAVVSVQVQVSEDGNGDQRQSQQSQQLRGRREFFLPLVATTDHQDDHGHWALHYDKAFAHLPALLTLRCDSATSSLADRWQALHDVIYGPSTTLVFSAQRLLLGVMHAMSTHPDPKVRAAARSGSPKHLFDARVACYLCNPELKEKELELSELLTSLSVSDAGVFGACAYPGQGKGHSPGHGFGRDAVSGVLVNVTVQLNCLHTAYATMKARLAAMNGVMVMQRIGVLHTACHWSLPPSLALHL
jgi:hypothetical protein